MSEIFNFQLLFFVFAFFLFAGSYHCCNSSGLLFLSLHGEWPGMNNKMSGQRVAWDE